MRHPRPIFLFSALSYNQFDQTLVIFKTNLSNFEKLYLLFGKALNLHRLFGKFTLL